MDQTRRIIAESAGRRWVQHLIFWLFSYGLLYRLLAYHWWPPNAADGVYVLLFHVSLVIGVYLNLLWLIPAYLRQGRYLVYAAGLVALVVIVVGLNLLTFSRLADWLVPGFYFITYFEWHELLPFAVAYLGITTLVKLSKGWFRELDARRRLQALEREKLDAELRALRHQLNPHFLFNSLNNLYGLAQENDPRLSGLLLKLSQVLRYVLRKTEDNFVPLEDELAYLQDYIDLQRLRSEGVADIRFRVSGEPGDRRIAPLLLLSFVENAFKYGIAGNISAPFVHIDIELEEGALFFTAKNKLGRLDEAASEKGGGIGLANTRRRLALLYPKRHELTAGRIGEEYAVKLTLELHAARHQTKQEEP